MKTNSGITQGRACAWSERWGICRQADRYTVIVFLLDWTNEEYAAVVDDFGNLVKVAA